MNPFTSMCITERTVTKCEVCYKTLNTKMWLILYCDGYLSRDACEGTHVPTRYMFISDSNCPNCIEKKREEEKGGEKGDGVKAEYSSSV